MAGSKGLSQARKMLSTEKAQETVNTKLEAEQKLAEQYKMLYASISVGDCVLRDNRTGVVVEKYLNPSGFPQAWVCWGISTLPQPVYPGSNCEEWMVQVIPSCLCRIAETSFIQQEAA